MFRILTNRRVLQTVALIAVLTAVAFWPRTMTVETATVARGPLVVTVDEEGRTRVRDRFVVSAPVAGRLLRIELEPGDLVERGDVVARLRPESPSLLDARTRAEASAALASAEAALGHARAEEQRALAALDHAQRELSRVQRLTEAGATTAQDRDAREADVKMANEFASAAAFAVGAASADVERARTRLTAPANAGLGSVAVVAPATGVVLRRLRESEAIVPAGEPLVELGDPAELEVVTDLLSTDAVSVAVGARATIEQWGGTVLAATVRRIEPAGFTKISALGVEEQRVNVVLDFADPVAAYARLGDAYRVEVRIVLWEAPDVLKVPTGALFRDGDAWAVYVTDNGRARLAHVALGRQTGREAEIASGLGEGARVIIHPGDLIRDGVRVEARADGS